MPDRLLDPVDRLGPPQVAYCLRHGDNDVNADQRRCGCCGVFQSRQRTGLGLFVYAAAEAWRIDLPVCDACADLAGGLGALLDAYRALSASCCESR